MAKYRNYKNKLEMFLGSRKGRRFLNIAYSWGAAVVILGALFKLLHWPFGNQMLFIGMMTEFLVFFISGLEKPEEQYKWEQVYPELLSYNPLDKNEIVEKRKYLARKAQEVRERLSQYEEKEGSDASQEEGKPSVHEQNSVPSSSTARSEQKVAYTPQQTSSLMAALPEEEVEKLASSLQKLQEAVDRLTQISQTTATTMESCKQLAIQQDGISQETELYHKSLSSLNQVMKNLGDVYESQLRDISGQVKSIEEINGRLDNMRYAYQESQLDSDLFRQENAQMLQRIRELNAVYARLLEAMTINMAAPAYPPYRQSDYIPRRERPSEAQYGRFQDQRSFSEGNYPSERDSERYPR